MIGGLFHVWVFVPLNPIGDILISFSAPFFISFQVFPLSLRLYLAVNVSCILSSYPPMSHRHYPPRLSLCISWWHLFTTQASGCLQFCSVICLLPSPEWGHSLGQRSRDRIRTNTHAHTHAKPHDKPLQSVRGKTTSESDPALFMTERSCRFVHSPCEHHHEVHDVPTIPQVRVLVEGETKRQDLYSRLKTEDPDEVRLRIILRRERERGRARAWMWGGKEKTCRIENTFINMCWLGGGFECICFSISPSISILHFEKYCLYIPMVSVMCVCVCAFLICLIWCCIPVKKSLL